jgi:hypothetical protein
MRSISAIFLGLSFFASLAHAAPAVVNVKAIRVAFSDFGTGAASAPQKKALALVGKAVTDRIVGFYEVDNNGEHGESTFCVGINVFVTTNPPTGSYTDLQSLYNELAKLTPKKGEMYALALTKLNSCED